MQFVVWITSLTADLSQELLNLPLTTSIKSGKKLLLDVFQSVFKKTCILSLFGVESSRAERKQRNIFFVGVDVWHARYSFR
jgi:hypothetical protein